MEITEFIKSRMTDFVKRFPEAKVCYEYDRMANVHVIEILPLSLYNSQSFIDWEWNFGEEALTAYPEDEIGFISEDAIASIKHVDFSIAGTQYGVAKQQYRKVTGRDYTESQPYNRVVCEEEAPYSLPQ
jgi:hypothetical protein